MAQLFEIRDGAASVGSYSGNQIREMAADGRIHAGMEIRQVPSGEWAPIARVKGLQFTSPNSLGGAASEPSESGDDPALRQFLLHRSAAAPEPSETQDDGGNVSPAEASPADPVPSQPSAPNSTTSAGVVVAALVPDPNAAQASATQTPPPVPTGPATGVAEIECPFCAELIKAAAKKCKHCGEFLDPTLLAGASGNAISMTTSRASLETIPASPQPTIGDAVKGAGKGLWNLPVIVPILLVAAIPIGLIGLLFLFHILAGASYYGIWGLPLLAAVILLPLLLVVLVWRRS